MHQILSVAFLTLAGAAIAGEPPTAEVTGRRDGKEQSYQNGQDTIGLGLAVSVVGSARLEFPATKERWDAAAKPDHLRVRFAKPMTLTAQMWSGNGKAYVIDELLINTTPWQKRPPLPTPNNVGYFLAGDTSHWGKDDSLLIRCGDKYYSLSKYDGMLTEPLIHLFGPKPRAKDE